MKFKAQAGKLVAFQGRLLKFDSEGVYETDNEAEIAVLLKGKGVIAEKPKAAPKSKPKTDVKEEDDAF
jgi:hypothetical protein